eukprot:898400-Amphidinium_carterae.2
MDYIVLKHQGEPGQRTRLVTGLTMVETVTGMSNAVIVENKRVTQYALGEVKKFILENAFINTLSQVDGEPAIKRFESRTGCHLPLHTSHVVHVKAGTQSYSVTADFSDCRCQNSLAFHSVRSLQIIPSSHGWSSMLDSLTTYFN